MSCFQQLTYRVLSVFLVTVAAVCTSSAAWAHNPVEVSAAVGYRFGGSGDVEHTDDSGAVASSGRFVLAGAPSFSGTVGYRLKPNGFGFLTYSRQQTTMRYQAEGGAGDLSGRMAIEYYQLGGNLEKTHGIWVPYFGASVGLARFLSLGGAADRVFFAAGLDGGLKVDVHRQVHLRLVGRLPLILTNKKLFCRDGQGCVNFDKFSPVVQGEIQIGAGVSF